MPFTHSMVAAPELLPEPELPPEPAPELLPEAPSAPEEDAPLEDDDVPSEAPASDEPLTPLLLEQLAATANATTTETRSCAVPFMNDPLWRRTPHAGQLFH